MEKYQPFIKSITNRKWNVEPSMVIVASIRATTHISSTKTIKTKLKIPKKDIRGTFKKINTIAIYHAMFIILHRKRIDNNDRHRSTINLQKYFKNLIVVKLLFIRVVGIS